MFYLSQLMKFSWNCSIICSMLSKRLVFPDPHHHNSSAAGFIRLQENKPLCSMFLLMITSFTPHAAIKTQLSVKCSYNFRTQTQAKLIKKNTYCHTAHPPETSSSTSYWFWLTHSFFLSVMLLLLQYFLFHFSTQTYDAAFKVCRKCRLLEDLVMNCCWNQAYKCNIYINNILPAVDNSLNVWSEWLIDRLRWIVVILLNLSGKYAFVLNTILLPLLTVLHSGVTAESPPPSMSTLQLPSCRLLFRLFLTTSECFLNGQRWWEGLKSAHMYRK